MCNKRGYNHLRMTIPKIDSYQFGKIVIDGQPYTRDVIITPQGVLAPWWRVEGHTLHIEDLEALYKLLINTLIIGQGSISRMEVPTTTLEFLQKRFREVLCLPTAAACERYNLEREREKVAAALHLTC